MIKSHKMLLAVISIGSKNFEMILNVLEFKIDSPTSKLNDWAAIDLLSNHPLLLTTTVMDGLRLWLSKLLTNSSAATYAVLISVYFSYRIICYRIASTFWYFFTLITDHWNFIIISFMKNESYINSKLYV